jgi:eukaryotic-like serine/threonine-protein kinase
VIGKQIGNYQIQQKLGEGGMGVVYKAIDLDLERPVAVKVLSAALSQDPALLERFRSEAKAQANLGHTNIAALYSLLNIDNHTGIVMEYIDGETLNQILKRRGPISWQEALSWFEQALRGIGFAHRKGVIHRDLKPSNLMVNRDGVVKVMDFGIAKMLGGQGLTQTGMQLGTVAYMSPEQIRNQTIDARSDIYSLGVTLYELLTVHLPFETGSDFEVMSDHVNTPPPPPSRYAPSIPQALQACILRALAKEPSARYQSVEEFSAALDAAKASAAASSSAPQLAATRLEQPAANAFAAPPAPAAFAQPLNPGSKGKGILFGGVLVILAAAVLLGYQAMKPKAVPSSLASSTPASATPSAASPKTDTVQPPASPSSPPPAQAATDTAVNSGKSDNSAQPDLMKSLNGIAEPPRSEKKPVVAARHQTPLESRIQEQNGRSAAKTNTASPAQEPLAAPDAPSVAPSGPTEAQLETTEDDLSKIKGRIDAVNQSLTNLKQQQAAQGYGLRGDMVAAESRLYSYFGSAQQALQNRNVDLAQKNMERAEKELVTLEHFLGR